jgi:hypothetical protein
VYVDFVESLEVDSKKPKGWVKGATIVPAAMAEQEREKRESEPVGLYRPSLKAGLGVDFESVRLSV